MTFSRSDSLSVSRRISVRARALCYGLLPTPAAREALLRLNTDPGFVHGIPFEVEGRYILNTAVLDAMTHSELAVPLGYEAGEFVLDPRGAASPCAPIAQPALLNEPTPFGGIWADFVRLHSRATLFVTPLRQCIFGAQGRICKFCTFEGATMLPAPVRPLANIITQLVRSDPNILDVAFGSGTPNLRDCGIRYFARLAEFIAPAIRGGISVELVPPPDLEDLQILKAAGVSALIMSIEIWDDATRREICPGKSDIAKDHYRAAWQRAVSIFGRGNVSSVLLAGLDTIESIEAAIDEMTTWGVVPTIIPFRPYDASAMSTHQLTDMADYLGCARYNAEALLRMGLSPLRQAGCTKCQGCSIDAPEDWSSGLKHVVESPAPR